MLRKMLLGEPLILTDNLILSFGLFDVKSMMSPEVGYVIIG